MKSSKAPPKVSDDAPLALLVDDDPMHNKILSAVLKKLGITSIVTTSAKEFLARLKEVKPNICLVDLNIDELGVGYTLIKAVRKVLGNSMPIIVLSGQSDRQAIAHALEVGANDFIAKPLDRAILASKLTRYLMTEELLVSQSSFFPVPEGGSDASLVLDFVLREVDEFGIRISSRHLLNKGSVFYIDSVLLHEITGTGEAHLFTITSTFLEPDGESYAAFAEFDHTNENVLAGVRRWLSKQH